MYYLDRLKCNDWKSLGEVGLIGIEMETQRLNKILNLRKTLMTVTKQTPFLFYVSPTFFYLRRTIGPRSYNIYKSKVLLPPVLSKKDAHVKNLNKVEKDFIKLASDEDDALLTNPNLMEDKYAKNAVVVLEEKLDQNILSQYVKNIKEILQSMGELTIIPELFKNELRFLENTDVFYDYTQECNIDNTEKRMALFEDFQKNIKMFDNMEKFKKNNTTVKLTLKNYIVSTLRREVSILSNINNVDELIDHNLTQYISVVNKSRTDFNTAFKNFNYTISNNDIEYLMMKYPDNEKIIDILKYVFITDIMTHFNYVKKISGQQGQSIKILDCYLEYVKILMKFIMEFEEVKNTRIDFRSINESFIISHFNSMQDEFNQMSAEEKQMLIFQKITEKRNIKKNKIKASPDVFSESAIKDEEEQDLELDNDEDDVNDILD